MSHNEVEEANITISVLCEGEEWLPEYASTGAAGADLRACIKTPITLLPGNSVLIPTGLRVAIPQNYEMQIRPRSGLALKHGITVLNTPGTIDSDYRGDVGVILINHSQHPFTIEPKMRIAQAVVAPVVRAKFYFIRCATEIGVTPRGQGGFGHTGTH